MENHELIVRIQGHRVWPYWSLDQWPTDVVGHVGLVEVFCPVCGQKAFQPRLFEARQVMPGDESLPVLLTLDATESPRGRFTWELSPCAIVGVRTSPHYYLKSHAIVWALLSPDAKWYRLTTRRYHSAELWPWWGQTTKASGVLLSQEGDTREMYWLVGETLPLPEPKVVVKIHRRCGGGDKEMHHED